jgi:hypothetical protein
LVPPPVEHVGRGARFDNLTLAKDQHLVAFPRIILTAFTDAITAQYAYKVNRNTRNDEGRPHRRDVTLVERPTAVAGLGAPGDLRSCCETRAPAKIGAT